MKRLLQVIGGIVLLFLVGFSIWIAMNYTLVRNMLVMRSASVTSIEKYQPQGIVAGCAASPLPRATPEQAGVAPAALAAAQAYSDEHDGIGLMVLRDGAVIYETYSEGRDADSLAESYSMHKSVLGLMIGLAIRDGYINSIDDPVSRYITAWQNDPRGEITLRQLLTMSSGLNSPAFQTMQGMKLFLSDEIEETALSVQPGRMPDQQFAYGNVNSQIVGAALRQALASHDAGQYQDYLSRELWCPLGNGEARLWLDKQGGTPRFYAALMARLQDWARIGLMLQNKGNFMGRQIVPADWVVEMLTPAKTNPNYGLHIWIGSPADGTREYSTDSPLSVPHKEPYAASDVFFFDGFGGQRVYVVPSKGLVIARAGVPSMTFDDSILVNTILGGYVPEPETDDRLGPPPVDLLPR